VLHEVGSVELDLLLQVPASLDQQGVVVLHGFLGALAEYGDELLILVVLQQTLFLPQQSLAVQVDAAFIIIARLIVIIVD
jgi:hypothetical protein